MHSLLKLVLVGSLLAIVNGCGSEDVLVYHVAPYKQACMRMNLGECLLVKEQPEDSWHPLYESIEGFTYESGYSYVLEVERREIENPPADGYPYEYRLLRVVEKKKE